MISSQKRGLAVKKLIFRMECLIKVHCVEWGSVWAQLMGQIAMWNYLCKMVCLKYEIWLKLDCYINLCKWNEVKMAKP